MFLAIWTDMFAQKNTPYNLCEGRWCLGNIWLLNLFTAKNITPADNKISRTAVMLSE